MNTSPKGAIRPNSTQTLNTTADGTAIDFRWIKEPAIIKRVRRKLAERGQFLIKTREGTDARRELGEGTDARRELGVYAVADENREVVLASLKIDSLARALGVLADDEKIDPPMSRGWRYYIGRQVSEDVGGKRAIHVVRITKDYTTPEAAWKAAEDFECDDLIEVGYLADRQEGRHDAR